MDEVVPVHDLDSLRYLVKEYELFRCRRGRVFFIGHIGHDSSMQEVSVNERDEILIRGRRSYRAFSESELPGTELGDALKRGRLYTIVV